MLIVTSTVRGFICHQQLTGADMGWPEAVLLSISCGDAVREFGGHGGLTNSYALCESISQMDGLFECIVINPGGYDLKASVLLAWVDRG